MRVHSQQQTTALKSSSSLASEKNNGDADHGRLKIRDFGYPVGDPRHWGGLPVSLSKAPTKSSLNNLSLSRAPSGNNLDKKDMMLSGKVDTPQVDMTQKEEPMDEDQDDEDDDADFVMFKDVVSCYLPRAMSILDQHSKMGPIRLAKKKVLYKFSKVSEWEMDLKATEIVVVTYLPGSFNETTSERRQSEDVAKCDAKASSLDRWVSIEEDDDDDLSSLSNTQASAGVDNAMTKDPMSHIPAITLVPDPASFVDQIKEFLDYQPVYGSGWVTAIKVRVKEGKTGNTRLQMLDIGLVPTSYVGMA
ncbi:hypothetical protein BC829DRAFT_406968 [Chytridium lagenaria]|nr:hypothetical protein BC829DRAFT_406968 [Chytridium lagenaria]